MTDYGTAHTTENGTRHELAQVNIGRLTAPLDSEQLRDFAEGLDPVNAVADASDGFVWRLKDDTGDATSFRIFDDAWLPTVEEAEERLVHLRTHGPTPYAFNLRTSFPAGDAGPEPEPTSEPESVSRSAS
ncbi:hypothetical protein CG723_25885 [Streptomyces sp. CB01635]|uniref:DUF3291 domain-containing protein n=1 Tax=unclassified Streptomyces TaxID=2593676 RepID=UPI000C27E676|nr:DUF3291 domain-containing protein [Streptomyces sp. CB01635]PJN09024.1 hypothetical protein CG723_25885 [Streptomyces sp. CB01635]